MNTYVQSLLIFTKNPILGTVKTRIGKDKGDITALKVYQKLLLYTRDVVLPVDAHKTVFFNRHIETEGIWEDSRFDKAIQVAGDLGKKMEIAISEEFERANKVIIIGSDCATLTSQDIEDAFNQLDQYDVVIGPAEDGGYYLLGLNKMTHEIFEDMPWSQSSLLNETIRKINNAGLSHTLLDRKSDIDYWEDWEKLGWVL